jgi:hypothetical protein
MKVALCSATVDRVQRQIGVAVAAVLLGLAVFAGRGSAATPTPVRVIVVKVTWGPQPEPDVQNLTEPTAAFFANASFGTVQLAFTETPWLNAYASASVCADIPQVLDQGQAAAAAYQPATYDHVIYVTPCAYVDVGSDALHRGTVGLPASPQVFEHELAHTFGISHAGSLDCDPKCTLDPYGNLLDVMGGGIGDFGALQKAEAGWPVTIRYIPPSGTYTLAALETRSSLPQALVIRRGSVDIWIDHREAIANDSSLKTSLWKRVSAGVLVHEAPANAPQLPFAQRRPDFLLGNGGPEGFWLMHGKTFTIPHIVRITVLKHTGTTVTVRLAKLR